MAKPDYNAFTVIERDGDKKDFWQQVGVAFKNAGGSISVKLNALPINGELVLMEPTKKPSADDA